MVDGDKNQPEPDLPKSPKREVDNADQATRYVDPSSLDRADDETDFVFVQEHEQPMLLGEYEILEKIGAGGMGQVFRARHRTMQREVALKILPRKFSQHAHLVERFYFEVRALAKMMHPNIVTAFDAGCAMGVHFLVMELVEGVSLASHVATNGPLQLQDAVRFLAQASSALGYAHAQGIVHRDIKPGNMMWTPSGTLKILDFGLAHLTQEVNQEAKSKHLIGTVEFMAPEQIENASQVDHRTDLYSLGASLFYLLTGRTMFSGEPVQIALAHIKKQPPALYEVRSDLDLRIDAVFQKLVAKKPSERFPNAEAIQEMLVSLNLTENVARGEAKTTTKLPTLSLEPPTNRPGGEATAERGYSAIGIELGMMTSRASYLDSERKLNEIQVDGEKRSIRNMVWSDQEQIAVGELAAQRRIAAPNQIFYGFQRWFGIPLLERPFAGRRVPPEVLLAIVIRRMVDACRKEVPDVSHAVVTVPACYDQLHRHSVLTACRCAGIEPLQLLDRPLAAVLAHMEMFSQVSNAATEKQTMLVVSLHGTAGEASLVTTEKNVARPIASIGDVRMGLSRWHNRVAEQIASKFQEKHGIDIRTDLGAASRLQRTAEMAIDRLGVVQQVELRYEAKQLEIRWTMTREDLIRLCGDFLHDLVEFARSVMQQAQVESKDLSQLLFVGELFSIPQIRDHFRKSLAPKVNTETISKADLARGAALQASYLMPPMDTRGPHAETHSPYDIGLVFFDAGKPPTMPKILIPKGASLPTQFSRTLRIPPNNSDSTIQFVESTRLGNANWHRLGAIHPSKAFPNRSPEEPLQLRLEMDISGLLSCKLTWLAGNTQRTIPPLAAPPFDSETILKWQNWIETLFMCQTGE